MESSLPMTNNAQAEAKALASQAANQATQGAIGPWFWGSIWMPFLSYLWTVVWIGGNFIGGKVDEQSGVKIKLFNKAEVVSMLLLDFFWFFAVALLISIVAVVICHGGSGVLSGVAAWFARAAIKIGTLGKVNFDFCKSVPDITFLNNIIT